LNAWSDCCAGRVKMLDILAANKIAVTTYQDPRPGIGQVIKTGEGFTNPRADENDAADGRIRGRAGGRPL